MNSTKLVGAAILTATVTILAFQNCSRARFNTIQEQADGSSMATSSSTGTTPILCDPFSSPGGCGSTAPKTGLLGNVYYYPNGQKVNDYITKGTLLNVRVQMSKIDVPQRNWDDGFALPNGDQLLDDANKPMLEWFAIDFKGYMELPSTIAPGEFQFALKSDDGSLLDIDGKQIVELDGQHGVAMGCAPVKFKMEAKTKYPVRLRYFQGPRNHIALRLLWRPIAKSAKACDDTVAANGFTVVPAELFTH